MPECGVEESMSFGMTIIPGTVMTMASFHHGGNEKTGSVTLLNRQKWIVDGVPTSIPFVSGNSIRGQLRNIMMENMLKNIGYTIDVETGHGRKLFHCLLYTSPSPRD